MVLTITKMATNWLSVVYRTLLKFSKFVLHGFKPCFSL
nr:MAG TPA_asm: hypothetical protein [Bacteriophage sp.]